MSLYFLKLNLIKMLTYRPFIVCKYLDMNSVCILIHTLHKDMVALQNVSAYIFNLKLLKTDELLEWLLSTVFLYVYFEMCIHKNTDQHTWKKNFSLQHVCACTFQIRKLLILLTFDICERKVIIILKSR